MQPDNTRNVDRVFYDADCGFCVNAARRFEGVLARRRVALVPLQTPGASALVNVPAEDLLAEMRLRLRDGRVFGGAAAVAEIARRIWWAWPLWALSRLPGAMRPMAATYRWVAGHRSCGGGACTIDPLESVWPFGALPLLMLPIVALLVAPLMPRWGFMWVMACALYAGCKWLTYCQVRTRAVADDGRRALGYLLAWPGMDAKAFLSRTGPSDQPSRSEWMAAALKTAFGAMLIWVVARRALPVSPLLAGWIGMVGAIFVLHFGTFHLLSLVWRTFGVNAMPIMRSPLRSRSLSEFWGRRWNVAFHELASQLTFRPLRAWVGVTGATLLTFVASGLIHDLVISVPAGGGYGLPTGYFVLQGVGLAGERTSLGKRIGLGRGWRGWLFTVLVTAGPAFWLFPPAFVQRIILPMLDVIGAV